MVTEKQLEARGIKVSKNGRLYRKAQNGQTSFISFKDAAPTMGMSAENLKKNVYSMKASGIRNAKRHAKSTRMEDITPEQYEKAFRSFYRNDPKSAARDMGRTAYQHLTKKRKGAHNPKKWDYPGVDTAKNYRASNRVDNPSKSKPYTGKVRDMSVLRNKGVVKKREQNRVQGEARPVWRARKQGRSGRPITKTKYQTLKGSKVKRSKKRGTVSKKKTITKYKKGVPFALTGPGAKRKTLGAPIHRSGIAIAGSPELIKRPSVVPKKRAVKPPQSRISKYFWSKRALKLKGKGMSKEEMRKWEEDLWARRAKRRGKGYYR